MADLNKVLKGLECCQNGFVCGEGCPYREVCFNGEYAFTHLAKDALELLKSQQAEIAELKAEKHKPNCSSAEHNPSTGKCCGYGRSENDDEPIDACKSCELYDSYGIE